MDTTRMILVGGVLLAFLIAPASAALLEIPGPGTLISREVHRSGMWRAAIILLILLCSAGCVTPRLQEPTVTVDGVEIEKITPGSMDLSLHLTINNPNPVGATLTRVSFDVYFLDDGQPVFLAHGERGEFEVQPHGNTTISVPVTVDNLRLVQALILTLQEGTVTLQVNGSGVLDYGIATFEVPFSRTVEVRPGQGATAAMMK